MAFQAFPGHYPGAHFPNKDTATVPKRGRISLYHYFFTYSLITNCFFKV